MTEITVQNIFNCIKSGESETLEFKASFNDEAIECIGALANAHGGVVLIGVTDLGNISGIPTGKKTLEDIANKIQESTDPRLQPSLKTLHYDQKIIIVIQVTAATGAPVSVRGRYFKRVGKTNQRMSHEEIMQKFMASASKSWDMAIEPESSLKDLDLKKVSHYIELVQRVGRLPVPANTTNLDFLYKLELIKENDVPTRAAILLFGCKPDHYFGSAFLKVGRFKTPTMILDDREFHDTLIEQLDGVIGWFRERLETKFVISGKPQRDVIWEFPLDAIREAVTNTIIHRDYTSLAHSQIRLYNDHLEIWNSGGLLQDLTTEVLLKKHKSILRNRKIAEAFFYAGLIEQWGSGTIRIAEELRLSGMLPPKFEIDAYNFRIGFYKQKVSSITAENITGRQIKIVDFLEQNEHGLKSPEILRLLGEPIAKRTLRDDLMVLKKLNLIKSSGRGKNAIWIKV